jgi:ABC-type transport system involved in cytochrome bd biosynthesis fused ATPase/permease subunit
VTFEDVVLRYPGEARPTLTGFSLTVAEGDLVALTGPSGSGKSSLLALALRSYDPDRGRVLLGGADLRTLPLRGVRGRLAWAAQAPQLLGSTLAGNLRLARPSATDEELVEALENLDLHDLLSGVGLNGWIGEAGSRLSAGERARVAVSRALLSPAPVLLLDEPTAHLDHASALRLLHRLEGLGRTVLLVTHSPELLGARWRVVRVPAVVEPGPPLARRHASEPHAPLQG